jgi:hypothetical protein
VNVNVQMTLDGMIRALRWKAHAAAEEVERGGLRFQNEDDRHTPRAERVKPEAGDGIRGE